MVTTLLYCTTRFADSASVHSPRFVANLPVVKWPHSHRTTRYHNNACYHLPGVVRRNIRFPEPKSHSCFVLKSACSTHHQLCMVCARSGLCDSTCSSTWPTRTGFSAAMYIYMYNNHSKANASFEQFQNYLYMYLSLGYMEELTFAPTLFRGSHS